MGKALDHSTYMFLIITERSCDDCWAEMQRDESLMESITNPDKRWSVASVTSSECLQKQENEMCHIVVFKASA